MEVAWALRLMYGKFEKKSLLFCKLFVRLGNNC